MTMRPVDSIHIGHRHRRDLGNVNSLARSISEVGLLHPIPIPADGTLIAGDAACERANPLAGRRLRSISCR